MTDFLIVAIIGAGVFWVVGPQTKFTLHFSIYLAILFTIFWLEVETYTTCVSDDAIGKGAMICHEITRIK